MNCSMEQPVSNDQIYSYDSPNIIEGLYNNIEVSTLLPRNCRKELVVSVSVDVSLTRFSSIIEETLLKQMPGSNIYILKIDQHIDSKSDTTFIYKIVFMQVSKELIEKLKFGGVKTLHLYIGLSENDQEYPILDHIPELEYIAINNRNGESIPYNKTITL